jgi:hypothetical protein
MIPLMRDDEVEVFRREAELILSDSEGENRKISGCLQGRHVLSRDSSIILEDSRFPLQRLASV